MAFDFRFLAAQNPGKSLPFDDAFIRARINHLVSVDRVTMRRLWGYYANTLRYTGVVDDDAGSTRPYQLAQEMGLPSRITGYRASDEPFHGTRIEDVARKEVVTENDIAWRVDTICDYLFGKGIVIQSQASDPGRRAAIDAILRQVFANHGGVGFFQQLALYGAVYGGVDVLVKFDASKLNETHSGKSTGGTRELGTPPVECEHDSIDTNLPDAEIDPEAVDLPAETEGPASVEETATSTRPDASQRSTKSSEPGATTPSPESAFSRVARCIRLEIVEPARALPVFCSEDAEKLVAYTLVYDKVRQTPSIDRAGKAKAGLFARLRSLTQRNASVAVAADPDKVRVVELMTANAWQKYEDETLVAEGECSLGVLPVVHIQNAQVLGAYRGASEVEPLIPIQDEINTRLSDRAFRITMQSFKMYLAKGVENVANLQIGPGRIWTTDNEQADIVEFGGDGKTFSEDNQIAEMREAMDKISGVTPIAAGVIRRRIGRLTSAAALRVTMLALLSKVERRRQTYGAAIGQMSELILAWLDHAGMFKTSPEEREIQIHWPSPLPVYEAERLSEAKSKIDLGVPREVVLRELGY